MITKNRHEHDENDDHEKMMLAMMKMMNMERENDENGETHCKCWRKMNNVEHYEFSEHDKVRNNLKMKE